MKHLSRGFTMIELSIVLVIVGLIVGGILIGNDLIKAATIRAVISEMEEYNTAVNTFRLKYNSLPGDMAAAKAEAHGMVARSGERGHGDDNRLLEGCGADDVSLGCETVLFWTDLSSAQLISRNFIVGTDEYITLTYTDPFQEQLQQLARAFNPISDAWAVCCGGPSASSGEVLPLSQIGSGAYVTVFSMGGVNYYQIVGLSGTFGGIYMLYDVFTPMEALQIDSKVDNADPLAGAVVAGEGSGPVGVPATPGATTCVYDDGAAPYVYNTADAQYANQKLCQLIWQMQ